MEVILDHSTGYTSIQSFKLSSLDAEGIYVKNLGTAYMPNTFQKQKKELWMTSTCVTYLLSSHWKKWYPSKSTLASCWLAMLRAANANFRRKRKRFCQPYWPRPGDYPLVTLLIKRLITTHLKYDSCTKIDLIEITNSNKLASPIQINWSLNRN